MAKSDQPSVASRIRSNQKQGMSPERATEAGYKSNTAKPNMSPEEAELRVADPETGEQCATCAHFLGDACEVVQGPIMPDMISTQYVPAQREEPTIQPGTGGQMGTTPVGDPMAAAIGL